MAKIPTEDLLLLDATAFTIITDPEHPLFDERASYPVDEALARDIGRRGVLKPVLVQRDGAKFLVVDGRQRVRAAQLANEAARAEGADVIRVPARVKRFSADLAASLTVLAANMAIPDGPRVRAAKIQRALDMGASKGEIADIMRCSRSTLDNYLALLDCDTEVQAAVDAGDVAPTTAREFAGMERDEQRALLAEMKRTGALKGTDARAKVRGARLGNAVLAKSLSKRAITKWRDALRKVDDEEAEIVVAVLDRILGDETANERLSIPVCLALAGDAVNTDADADDAEDAA